jgi:hypothetical protein
VAADAPTNGISKVFRYSNLITHDPALAVRDHFIIKVGAQWFCTGTVNY